MIAFDEPGVRRSIAAFRRTRCIDDTPVTIVPHLRRALEIAELKGPDPRWRSVPFWSADDDPGDPPFGYAFKGALLEVDQSVYHRVLELEGQRRGQRSALWVDSHSILPASRWARFSLAMRDAHDAGLGWLFPVHREVLAVPMPAVRTAEGRPNVLHDDVGRPAVE